MKKTVQTVNVSFEQFGIRSSFITEEADDREQQWFKKQQHKSPLTMKTSQLQKRM